MIETKGFYRVRMSIEDDGDFWHEENCMYSNSTTGDIDVVVDNIEVAQSIVKTTYNELVDTIGTTNENAKEAVDIIKSGKKYIDIITELRDFIVEMYLGNYNVEISIIPVIKKEYGTGVVSYYAEDEYGFDRPTFNIYTKESFGKYIWENIQEIAELQANKYSK